MHKDVPNLVILLCVTPQMAHHIGTQIHLTASIAATQVATTLG